MNAAAEPIDIFAEQIAKLSARRSWRALGGMNPADREDAIADAVLEAWQTKYELLPGVAVDEWFTRKIAAIAQRYRRRRRREESLPENFDAVAPSNTVDDVALSEAVDCIARNRFEAAALELIQQGDDLKTAASQCGLSIATVRELRRCLKHQLQGSVASEEPRFAPSAATPSAGNPDDVDAKARLPHIDQQLEAFFNPITNSGECKVCVHCSWFEGVTTGAPRAKCIDAEIYGAIRATERAKRFIAWSRATAHEVAEFIESPKPKGEREKYWNSVMDFPMYYESKAATVA